MRSTGIIDWKEAPFLRFIPPLIIGILIQWHYSLPINTAWTTAIACSTGLLLFSRLPLSTRFRFRPLNGILLNALLFATGLLLVYYKDIRHQQQWFPPYYAAGDTILATIQEPLSEKSKAYSTTAVMQAVIKGTHVQKVKGRLLLYFPKDSPGPPLSYGHQLMFVKSPEPISNAGNPGAFDYRRYCAFKGIYHQVYLRKQDYIIAEKRQLNPVKKVLYHTREILLDILRKNIPDKKQAGLAEALLIGYKDDLDKQLLQSYINTGVVHVIAVSGLHLGLIYALLIMLCNQMPKRWDRWVAPIIIIASLWLFSLLSGASPSVLRSAIMFTCLIIGNRLPHPASVYNSLAASAFLLLCYDPWYCWDIGFQLSYAAVFSILLFRKPIYHSIFIQNKYLNYGWKLIAITLAAQILTLPLTIYHFHQFPGLFLITNLVAVPLSSIILVGELLLCAVAFVPAAAKAIAWLLQWLISLLNTFIETINQVPYNSIDGIQLNIPQAILLYSMIAGITVWLLQKKKTGLLTGLGACWLWLAIQAGSWWMAARQQKLIIYNVPRHQAMDFITGRQYVFKGDSTLLKDPSLENFHLKPCRTAHRISPADSLTSLSQASSLFTFGNTSLLLVDKALPAPKSAGKIPIDIIILSHNAKVSAQELINLFTCNTVVIDPTNTHWKTRTWQQDFQKLGISCHAVTSQGAFVLTLH
ncbi:ComEC family competence protein [Paraflavitalea soli]|uniref:ComEC family competence protein n=1 Tax=Paraflavitalea soli TaxID=2315862 RepID=A0A3B7MP57_9BACT|nr:ComEC/Rec2 family competence protein [Paraflavitalea soli]AXY76294.1 ComEC family competence protein [Paraflavitalea soli]